MDLSVVIPVYNSSPTLDELLTLYEDDEEGWFARAQIAEGQYGPAPFYKSLLKLNPFFAKCAAMASVCFRCA